MEKTILTSKICDEKIQININNDATIYEIGATLKIILNTVISNFSFPEYIEENEKLPFFLNELQTSLISMTTIAATTKKKHD